MLFATGASGRQVAGWLRSDSKYQFRLYVANQRQSPIATIDVPGQSDRTEGKPQPSLPEDGLFSEYKDLLHAIAQILRPFVQSPLFEQHFQFWEKNGFHLTPVHFYQPVPDTRCIASATWSSPSQLVGIEMNDERQLDFLQHIFPRFKDEYNAFPSTPSDLYYQFYLNNNLFDGTDALVLYCMVRHFRPKIVLEVGSGMSSRISAQAALKNGNTNLVCIEPYPDEILQKGFPGLESLVSKPVQDIPLEEFLKLQRGDILFIDTSHVVRCGGDVNYLFLEIIPRLQPGVVVHVHDIFFPMDYPERWVRRLFRFWTEQYLLQAFLAFNSSYEVLLCNSYLDHYYNDQLRAAFPRSPWWGGGSFWMQRRVTAS